MKGNWSNFEDVPTHEKRPTSRTSLFECLPITTNIQSRVEGFGFRFSVSRSGVWGMGSEVWGLGFGVQGAGFGVRGLGCRDSDLAKAR